MTKKTMFLGFCLAAGVAMSASGGATARAAGGANPHAAIGFDVAENMARFVFDDAPLDGDGMPAYGTSFVTQGYLYPLGFLIHHEGTLPDGSPAHPEMVIGIWTCRGHFVGDGAKTTSGPWVVSTQLYDFFETPGYDPGKASGRHNLIAEGNEIADVGVTVVRSVTGTTGRARTPGKNLEQQLLGFNESGGVDLRVVLPVGFAPVIAYRDLPSSVFGEQDLAQCLFDLGKGLVCNGG
ncbi:MAG: hypothetical protein WBG86_20175 [Polyangiales bacterium]